MRFALPATLAIFVVAYWLGALGELLSFLWPSMAAGALIGAVAALLPDMND